MFTTKPLQTEGAIRQFKNGQWTPTHTGLMNACPGGAGLVIEGFRLQANRYIAPAFPVGASNELPDLFKFVKELNNTTKSNLRAAIATDTHGSNLLGDYGGKETQTDEPFGRYVKQGSAHAGGCLVLRPAVYFLLIESIDNVEVEVPLGHQGSNGS
jgi:hypothetical protein